MTILKATNNLCKVIQKLPIREKLQNIFNDLISSGRDISLGSIATHLNRQFLGYIIANYQAHKQRVNVDQYQPESLIDLLSTEEVNIFEEIHKHILRINNNICSLESFLPNAQSSISPYSDYNFSLVASNPTKFMFEEMMDKAFEEMSKVLNDLQIQFQNHPSIKVIQDCIDQLSGTENINISEEDFIKTVINYRNAIIQDSLFNRTGNLELELFNRRDPLQFYMGRLLRSLIVLRDSISNIDQFIYQAIRYEKPLILNRDNVFEYNGMKQNWVGDIIYLRVQPIGKEVYSKPGEFVLVSLKLEDLPKDGFYRIEQMNFTDSSDFGSSLIFGLRLIDENMVCYPNLLT